MRNRTLARVLWLLLAAVFFVPTASAQHWYQYSAPPDHFDWQIFAPVHENVFLADEHPENEGYFFNVERGRYWGMRPDRAPIGNAGVVQDVFLPSSVNYLYVVPDDVDDDEQLLSFRVAVLGTGNIGNQYNGIDDAYAAHATGWGNHFELGWVEDSYGWLLRVYQGIDLNRTDRYGFDDKRLDQLGAAQGLDGVDGFLDPDGNLIQVTVNPLAPVPGFQAILAVDGLLSVPVLFDDPDRLLDGLVITTPGAPAVTSRIGVVFDDMEVNNQTNINSVEVSAIRRKKQLHGGGTAEFFLGARYLELDDRFNVLARGGVLADTDWNNHALNRIVGPQLGLRVAKRSKRWTSSVQARFMAGANFLSIRQTGTIGSHLINDTIGLPRVLGANSFFHRVSAEQFSPTGELNYETAFQLTKNVAFKVSWVGTVVGGVTRASNTVVYRLPNLGISRKQEEMFAHGVSFGVEINR